MDLLLRRQPPVNKRGVPTCPTSNTESGENGNCPPDTFFLCCLFQSLVFSPGGTQTLVFKAAKELGAFSSQTMGFQLVISCPVQTLQCASFGHWMGESPAAGSLEGPSGSCCPRENAEGTVACSLAGSSLCPDYTTTSDLVSNAEKSELSCLPSASISCGCPNKLYKFGGLNNGNVIFHSAGGWKPEIKVLAGLCSSTSSSSAYLSPNSVYRPGCQSW